MEEKECLMLYSGCNIRQSEFLYGILRKMSRIYCTYGKIEIE